MNISLPDELRAFADEQVSSHLYASSSEYVRELIRRDRDNVRLRDAVLDGIRSGGRCRPMLLPRPLQATLLWDDGGRHIRCFCRTRITRHAHVSGGHVNPG